MSEKNPDTKKSPATTNAEKNTNENAVRSKQDRLDDPLFVPHIEALEISAERESVGGDEYSAMLETICGVRDDSQPVEQYDGTLGVPVAFVAAHQSPACQVQWNANLATIYTNPGNVSGVRWGSGTMIADDLFLTCGHLFDQTGGGWERPRQNGTTNIITPQEIARNMRLNFNFQVDPAGNLRAEQSFPIVALIEYRLGGIDMSVCQIGGNPGATFGRTLVSPTDAAKPDMLCIIGHPAGQPKRIEAGPTTDISGNLIRYGDIDTLGGNSGSGILRASDGRLVGIHTNGGCTAASPGDGGTNFGQRIAAVIAVSPTLQRLLSPASVKFRDDLPKPTLDKPVVDTPVTLKFRDDLPKPTLDKPVVDTPVTLKFRDDLPKPTLDKPISDTPVTLKFRDDLPKPTLDKPASDTPVTLKFRDDQKLPGLDKLPGLEGKLPSFDRPGPFGRPFGSEAQSTRPFILITPHHSKAWSGGGQQAEALGQMEAALVEMEQTMAAGEAELAQLDAEYRQLLVEFEAAGGDIGAG